MGLLDKGRRLQSARVIKLENTDDGLEGSLVHIKRFAGRRYTSTDYYIQTSTDPNPLYAPGELVVLRVSDDTVLGRMLEGLNLEVGDLLAVLRLETPPGKNYGVWFVDAQNVDGKSKSAPQRLTKDREKERKPGNDEIPMPSDDDIPF